MIIDMKFGFLVFYPGYCICTLEPLDVYCYFYISNTENFFEEFQKLQFSRIIAAISFLIILSSGNMAALCVSKLKFYKNLWLLSKIASLADEDVCRLMLPAKRIKQNYFDN